jgi:drug/metabolite transporter (DMT)-like permease
MPAVTRSVAPQDRTRCRSSPRGHADDAAAGGSLPVTSLALGLVLLAALMHASWNALVKAQTDRALVLAAVSAMHALTGVTLVATMPWPAAAAWPSILISTTVHYGYYVLLFRSYRHGDLSQVYPISRGMAPAVVAISAWAILGESLSPLGWTGLALVSSGIGLLALQRGAVRAPPGTLGLALTLGLCIACYSVADGIGVRASGSPLGYIGWLFLLEAPVPLAIALNRRRNRGPFSAAPLVAGLAGGIFAVSAYGIVLWVKTFTPLGAVSAVRESSVIIAALIGVLLFGERPWKIRLFAAAVVAAGVTALAQSG